jgi:Ca2+-transporting ATPase
LAVLEANRDFSAQGLRVLAFAYQSEARAPYEEELIFLGLQAMRDPPRPEVPEAIRQCRAAGIKVIMITGDHEATARAVAAAIGLEGKALSGRELDQIDDLGAVIEGVAIFARVNPEHKLKIVDALKRKGHHIVAMTGDGVNDAPALKKSDIGVAMGISGTDVSKEASDMVLIDDNFASIVQAIEEGRKIYDNIKNYVQYLLSSNIAEVFIIFLAILLGLPIPLVAIQILLMNLVTDGAPAIALSLEPGERDIMRRQPRHPQEHILSPFMAVKMISLAGTIILVTLVAYASCLQRPCSDCQDPLTHARTFAFTTLVMLEMFNVLNSKSDRRSMWTTGLLNNPWLWMAIASSVLIQVVVVQWVPYELFNTVPLSGMEWLICVLLGSSALFAGEVVKKCGRLWCERNELKRVSS